MGNVKNNKKTKTKDAVQSVIQNQVNEYIYGHAWICICMQTCYAGETTEARRRKQRGRRINQELRQRVCVCARVNKLVTTDTHTGEAAEAEKCEGNKKGTHTHVD